MPEKVSIIVPVYNAEKYLEDCLNSIINQSYPYFEVILIDDGSADNSSNICQKFKNLDDRIIYVFQKNKGVSFARNQGLNISKNELILFVDADDYLEKNHVEKLVSNLNGDEDMVVCGYNVVNKKNSITKINGVDGVIEAGDGVKRSIMSEKFGGYTFNKIFRKRVILDNGLKFDTELFIGEDSLFVIQYLFSSKRIKLSSCRSYNYVQHSTSTINSKLNEKNVYKLESHCKAIDQIINLISESNSSFFKRELRHLNIIKHKIIAKLLLFYAVRGKFKKILKMLSI